MGEKIQTIVELAEELYERVNELRTRVEAVGETVEGTAERVERVEDELDEQRAIVEAVAEDHGIDVEAVLADAAGGASEEGEGQPGEGENLEQSGEGEHRE